MRIHGKIASSGVNGPGKRAVVWTQGCNLACPGCWNPNTHDAAAGESIYVSDLVDWLVKQKGIEGYTFSGGEPMQQALELNVLVRCLKNRFPERSIGMYTGYTEKELETGQYHSWDSKVTQSLKQLLWKEVKENLDWAVMGRYNELKQINKPLVTSSNQELRLFTDRYKASDFPPQRVEFSITAGGLVTLTGFPRTAQNL